MVRCVPALAASGAVSHRRVRFERDPPPGVLAPCDGGATWRLGACVRVPSSASRLDNMRLLLLAVLFASRGSQSAHALDPLKMQPLGAYCSGGSAESGGNASDCGETTPLMWHGDLVMGTSNQRVRSAGLLLTCCLRARTQWNTTRTSA